MCCVLLLESLDVRVGQSDIMGPSTTWYLVSARGRIAIAFTLSGMHTDKLALSLMPGNVARAFFTLTRISSCGTSLGLFTNMY